MPRRMRGISPVIATVIILAVTIAIAIAVVGWIMGLFKSSTKTGTQLQVTPVFLNSTTLELYVQNKGTNNVTIVRISVEGTNFTISDPSTCTLNNEKNAGKASSPAGIWIGVGGYADITCKLTKSANIVSGVTYTVDVYAQDGTVIPVSITAS